MNQIVIDTINQLEDWKEGFFSGASIPYTGRDYEDLLDNIQVGVHECYASYLFKQLSDIDKKEVNAKIDWDVDFDLLTATYTEHEGESK